MESNQVTTTWNKRVKFDALNFNVIVANMISTTYSLTHTHTYTHNYLLSISVFAFVLHMLRTAHTYYDWLLSNKWHDVKDERRRARF